MRFWDAGKPVAPRKWRKQVAAEVSSPVEGEACTSEMEKQVISEVSSLVEGEACTPEMEKAGYFRGE